MENSTPTPLPAFSSARQRRNIGRLETPADVQREMRRLYSDAWHGHIGHATYANCMTLLAMLERSLRADAG